MATLSRAREEMYTCSAVSTAGASVGGPCKAKHTFSLRDNHVVVVVFLILMYTTSLDICVFGASRLNRLTVKNLKPGLEFIELKLILHPECL